MNIQSHTLAAHQSGAVLMISLTILLVLTLIGITSMSTTILEEKMAGGVRNQNMAFQAAEAALRDGESWISAQNPAPRAVAGQVVILGSLGDLTALNDTGWNNNAREYGTAGIQDISEVSADPRYIVEERMAKDRTESLAKGQSPTTLENVYYRLTARGTGGSTTIETILQSHYMVVSSTN